MSSQPIGACVIVFNSSKDCVLLGKRLNNYKAGAYGLPGGMLNLTEKVLDCAKRELKEETGLISDTLQYIGVVREIQSDYIFIHFVYKCESFDGDLKTMEPNKCEGWDFYKLNELPENLLPGHKAAIELFLNKNLQGLNDLA